MVTVATQACCYVGDPLRTAANCCGVWQRGFLQLAAKHMVAFALVVMIITLLLLLPCIHGWSPTAVLGVQARDLKQSSHSGILVSEWQ